MNRRSMLTTTLAMGVAVLVPSIGEASTSLTAAGEAQAGPFERFCERVLSDNGVPFAPEWRAVARIIDGGDPTVAADLPPWCEVRLVYGEGETKPYHINMRSELPVSLCRVASLVLLYNMYNGHDVSTYSAGPFSRLMSSVMTRHMLRGSSLMKHVTIADDDWQRLSGEFKSQRWIVRSGSTEWVFGDVVVTGHMRSTRDATRYRMLVEAAERPPVT